MSEYIDSEVVDCMAKAVSEALSPVFEGVTKGTNMVIGLAGEATQACAKATAVADSVRMEMLELKEQFAALKEVVQQVGGSMAGAAKLEELRVQMAELKEVVQEAEKAATAAAMAAAAPTGPRPYGAATVAAPAMTAEQAAVVARGAGMRRQILVDRASDTGENGWSSLSELVLKEEANMVLGMMEAKREGRVQLLWGCRSSTMVESSSTARTRGWCLG
jgi:hypothetical protein